ncbi:GSU2403 family nucleotidyltransferase fold protein [Gemmatimonadota bacterium]
MNPELLIDTVRPLRPYLPHLVLCGGWTLFVYRHWIEGEGPDPMRTFDLDMVSPNPLPDETRSLARCLHEAGYRSEAFGLDLIPPGQRFMHEQYSEIEFITPIVGNVTPPTVEVQNGLVAQSIRYAELLLHDPLAIQLVPSDLVLRVAAPATYFVQKALSAMKRARQEDRAKDLAYLFEFLHNFPKVSAGLESGVRELADVRPEWAKWCGVMIENLERLFFDMDADGVHLVSTQQPQPFSEYISSGGKDGEAEFRGLVFRTFRNTIELLRSTPLSSTSC